MLLAALVGHLGRALGHPVAAGYAALLVLSELSQLLMVVLSLALVWPLQAREAAADVLTHLLDHGLLLACHDRARVIRASPPIMLSEDLQLLNTDLGGGFGSAWTRSGRAQRLMSELLRGKAIAQLSRLVVGLLNGKELLIHAPHLLVGAALFVGDSTALGGSGHRKLGLAGHLRERVDYVAEEVNLSGIALIGILVVHYLYHFTQLLVAGELSPLEVEVEAQLAEADRAEVERLLVGFVELRRAIHQALVRLAVAHREYMAQLVARRLYRSVLHKLGYLRVEHAGWQGGELGEVWMVPCVALDANTPALLRHTEDESPAVLRVQVGVRQHEQALVLLQQHVVFQILEDLPCVELLHASVASDPRLHYASPLQLREVLLDVIELGFLGSTASHFVGGLSSLPLDAKDRHAGEEEFENGVHVVDEHLLE